MHETENYDISQRLSWDMMRQIIGTTTGVRHDPSNRILWLLHENRASTVKLRSQGHAQVPETHAVSLTVIVLRIRQINPNQPNYT